MAEGTRTVVAYFNSGLTHDLQRGPTFNRGEIRTAAADFGVLEINAPFAGRQPKPYKDRYGNSKMFRYPVNAIEFILPSDAEVEEFMEYLREIPEVGFVFEDILPIPQATAPDDPSFSSQWNLTDAKYGINILDAWDYSTGNSNMLVGLLDAGINTQSPGTDLVGRLHPWSIAITDQSRWLYNGIKHGYAVAGIIAANTDNYFAVAGIDRNMTMYAFDFVHHTWSQRITDIGNCITEEAGIINISWEWASPDGNDLLSMVALSQAHRDGALIVASMGNSSTDAQVAPSKETFTFGVGGYGNTGSRYGRYGEGVDVSAPAVNIVTLNNSSATTVTGTSVSATHVTGVASLLWGYYSALNLENDDIQNILQIAAVDGDDEYQFGSGRLNADRAFELMEDRTEFRHISTPGVNVHTKPHQGPRQFWELFWYDEDLDQDYFVSGWAEIDTVKADIFFGKTYSEPPYVWGRSNGSTGRSGDYPNYDAKYTKVVHVSESAATVESYRFRVYEFPTGTIGGFWSSDYVNNYSISVLEKPVPFAPNYLEVQEASGHPHLIWDAAKESDFQHYQVWRKVSPGYPKPFWELVATTTQPEYTDSEYDLNINGYFSVVYRVRVKDADGNYSAYTPTTPPVKAYEINGDRAPGETIKLVDGAVPENYALGRSYPNPANPSASIQFEIPKSGEVNLRIYNMQGQLVRILISEEKAAGYHQTFWDGNNDAGGRLASGVYIYRLSVSGDQGNIVFDQSRKLLLMK
jgi:hypothetical protein